MARENIENKMLMLRDEEQDACSCDIFKTRFKNFPVRFVLNAMLQCTRNLWL